MKPPINLGNLIVTQQSEHQHSFIFTDQEKGIHLLMYHSFIYLNYVIVCSGVEPYLSLLLLHDRVQPTNGLISYVKHLQAKQDWQCHSLIDVVVSKLIIKAAPISMNDDMCGMNNGKKGREEGCGRDRGV